MPSGRRPRVIRAIAAPATAAFHLRGRSVNDSNATRAMASYRYVPVSQLNIGKSPKRLPIAQTGTRAAARSMLPVRRQQ